MPPPPAPADRRLIVLWAAAAATLGGVGWVVKAMVIFATGDQPPVAYEAGVVLFPFALLGLWSALRGAGGKTARVGGVLAAIAAICGVLSLLVRAVGGESVVPSEDEVTLLTPFITLAGLGTLVALIALGIAVRRTRALAPGYESLPLAIGLAAFPLLIAGAALETVSERLFEVPIALLGLGWIGLGVALLYAAAATNADAKAKHG